MMISMRRSISGRKAPSAHHRQEPYSRIRRLRHGCSGHCITQFTEELPWLTGHDLESGDGTRVLRLDRLEVAGELTRCRSRRTLASSGGASANSLRRRAGIRCRTGTA